MNSETERRSHCPCGKHYAGDLTHAQIVAALRVNQYSLRTLLHGLSDAQLQQHVSPGERSIAEIVVHLAQSTAFYLQDTRQMLAEDGTRLADEGGLVGFTVGDTAAMYQQFATNEAQLANLFMGLSEAQWQQRGIIPLSSGDICIKVDDNAVHAVDHDREHLAEVKQRREQLGVPLPTSGCVCGLHHAGDISHVQMLAELRSHADEVAAMVQGRSDAQLRQPAPDGGWSVKQLIGHLRDSANTYFERVVAMLNQDNPTMSPMTRSDERFYNDSNVDAMLAAMKATDNRFADLLAALSDAQWQRTGVRKSADGDAVLIVDDTSVHHVDHEREHIAQIKQLLA